jgi:hypothetical protein
MKHYFLNKYSRLIIVFPLVLIFLYTFQNCTSKSKEISIPKLSYQLTKDFTVRLNGVPTRTWMIESKRINGVEYLFYGDVKSRDKIFVFNMDEKAWADTLIYEKEGPNGIGNMNGFFVHSKDSIYVVNSFAGNIHLMNGSQKLKTFNTKNKTDEYSITPFPTGNSLSGILNNKLFFYGFPEINSNDSKFYNKAKIGQAIDLKNGQSIIGGGYPRSFFNHTYPGVSLLFNSQLIYKDKIIQSYSLSDSIFVFDKNFIFEKSILVNSPTKLKTPFYDNKISEKESEGAYFDFYQSEGYGKIQLYDGKILIRRFYYSEANRESFDLFQNYEKTIQTGLIIYDLQKEILVGILKFDSKEIDQYPMIITNENGIYLSKENENEPEVDFYLLKWDEN